MKKPFMIGSVAAMMMLTGCGGGETSQQQSSKSTEHTQSHDAANHSGHAGSSDVPEGLEKAENPVFEVGSKAVITDAHMKGMKGAEATIAGAYNTVAYILSYTPTTGGERVTNHKWVIHEEIENAGDKPLAPGTEVTITANHMKGMKGAEAVIESGEQTTVYMVDYTPTTGGEKVTDHKWVTESELSAK